MLYWSNLPWSSCGASTCFIGQEPSLRVPLASFWKLLGWSGGKFVPLFLWTMMEYSGILPHATNQDLSVLFKKRGLNSSQQIWSVAKTMQVYKAWTMKFYRWLRGSCFPTTDLGCRCCERVHSLTPISRSSSMYLNLPTALFVELRTQWITGRSIAHGLMQSELPFWIWLQLPDPGRCHYVHACCPVGILTLAIFADSWRLWRSHYQSTSDSTHIFTDGSCRQPDVPSHSLTAWAVVDATSDRLIARGVCGGLHQSSDLGELRAIVVALEWIIDRPGHFTIWSDSAYASGGLHRLLQDLHDLPSDSYQQEWCRMQAALGAVGSRVAVQDVAAHGHNTSAWNSVDDWTSYWNNRTDQEAVRAHGLWPRELLQRWRLLREHHEGELRRLLHLQELHLVTLRARTSITAAVEAYREEQDSELNESSPTDIVAGRRCTAEWQGGGETLACGVAQFQQLTTQFGLRFCNAMMSWLHGQSLAGDAVSFRISFLEIAILWAQGFATELPRPDSTKKNVWVASTASMTCGAPTIAAVTRLMRHFFAALVPVAPPKEEGINLLFCGVHTPQAGIPFVGSFRTAQLAVSLLQGFTSHRPIRTANDLARPFLAS